VTSCAAEWLNQYAMSFGFIKNRVMARLAALLWFPTSLPMLEAEMERLRARRRELSPLSLAPFGYKIYSQNDEDGIIREIFRRIGTTTKNFVEIGAGDGLENNTVSLLFEGWKGLWIEASPRHTEKIERSLPETIKCGDLKVIHDRVTKGNVNDLISSVMRKPELDLLSIDIDGNDWHVLDAIRCVKPRVVVIEYNAKFVPPLEFCMDYDEAHQWTGDDCYGASLKFLEVRLAAKGYALAGCNLTGSNAFFVRSDLAGEKFARPFTAENHFEPARHALSGLPSGYAPSYRTLEKSRSMREAKS
jgi:hypothetical protein